MKKRIIIFLIILIILLGIYLIFFNNKKDKEEFDGKRTTTVQTTAVKKDEIIPEGYNLSMTSFMKDVSINDSLESIRSKIGSNGVKKDNGLYTIKYSDVASINIQTSTIKNDKLVYVEAIYDYSNLIDDTLDFSTDKTNKNKYKDLTYGDLVEKFKGAGYIRYISDKSTEYIWVNNKGELIKASFNKNKECTSYSGIIKFA